jgi:hypothetical protein
MEEVLSFPARRSHQGMMHKVIESGPAQQLPYSPTMPPSSAVFGAGMKDVLMG